MSIVLTRVDDRLIHGQVVVGWVQALDAKRLVLIDDDVRANQWERDLYALGVPAGLELHFVSVAEATQLIQSWSGDAKKTILLLGNVETTVSLCNSVAGIDQVNVGGLHEREGRSQRLPYLYLTESEARQLKELHDRGIQVTAQDVPTAKALPVDGWT
ncbi:MAG: PTS sugar transporter subunit IIB [Gemmatimonadota bacterium]|nr:PTS sugar transporter subunit IIB [Gemmatimonadota bacterium]